MFWIPHPSLYRPPLPPAGTTGRGRSCRVWKEDEVPKTETLRLRGHSIKPQGLYSLEPGDSVVIKPAASGLVYRANPANAPEVCCVKQSSCDELEARGVVVPLTGTVRAVRVSRDRKKGYLYFDVVVPKRLKRDGWIARELKGVGGDADWTGVVLFCSGVLLIALALYGLILKAAMEGFR